MGCEKLLESCVETLKQIKEDGKIAGFLTLPDGYMIE